MGTERRMRFAFEGGRSGAGRATWGQRAIWDAVAALGPIDAARYTVRGGGEVAPGYTVPAILDALGRLVRRHESLRTHLTPDADGELRQTVHASGQAAAVVVECGPGDVEHEAAALLDRLAERPFDCAAEWPIRAGIVESGGSARHMVFAVAHTAVDGWGLRHLVLDLADLTVNSAAEGAPGRLQPLDEAEYQASPRGRRQDAAARRHWCAKVERGPKQLLTPKTDAPAGQPFPNALLDSPALGRALPTLAESLKVSPAAVLLGGAATMVHRLGGSPEALFQVVVNNRFLPGLERAVSTIAQEGLFHLTVEDVPFDTLVRTAFGSSLATYRHAYYDKASLDRDLAGLPAADLTCFVNDTRGLLGNGAPPGEPRDESTLTWREFPPRPNVGFALDAVDGTAGSIGLTMTADPVLIPRPDIERFLVGIEELVVAGAQRVAGN